MNVVFMMKAKGEVKGLADTMYREYTDVAVPDVGDYVQLIDRWEVQKLVHIPEHDTVMVFLIRARADAPDVGSFEYTEKEAHS
jgi:hypothetical protein